MRSPIFAMLVAGLAGSTVIAQPTTTASPTPSASAIHPAQTSTVSSDKRQLAFAAMLEGQRYAWDSGRTRSQSVMATNASLAKAAFYRAVELDPTLAEAYTAIAELSVAVPPGDVPLGLELAAKAVKIDNNNIGGHRILARLNTLRSGLNEATFDPQFGTIAIVEWQEVVRLDPRNAEGWAFLAALYRQNKMADERINALRKWLAAAQPIEIGFFKNVMGRNENLAPEAASIKLGTALLEANKMSEAVEVLSLVIADAPDNELALELLRQAIITADARSSAIAIQSLQQAAYSTPNNLVLAILLGRVQARAGKVKDAILGLSQKAEVLSTTDPIGTAVLEVAIGDILSESGNVTDAVEAYEKALATRGILSKTILVNTDEKEFALLVFTKIVQTYKGAKRSADMNAAITRARKLLGKQDLFNDV